MTIEEFWTLIEANRASDDPYDHAEAVQSALVKRPATSIADFQRHLSELQVTSYSWGLWGAAYLINGGCSDDGFDYFRGWLILQGREVFERAITSPDTLADVVQPDVEAECEDILYVAQNAYETVANRGMPRQAANRPNLGEGWDFDDDTEMKNRYPRLFAAMANR